MKNKCLKGLITSFVLVISGFASAGIIYDNGTATASSNRCSETSGICTGSWTLFDDFIVSADSEITSITWTADFRGGLPDYNFSNIWIYDNDPVFNSGNLLFSFSSAGSLSSNALGTNFFDITLSGFSTTLSSGSYWLGFQHDTTADFGVMATTGSIINATQWQNDGAGLSFDSQPELAFLIEGNLVDVPEPSTLVVFALSLIALASRKIKRKA